MKASNPPDIDHIHLPRSTDRQLNFSAGPAMLPEAVLREAQADLWSIADSGIGILEHSHRGPVFDEVLAEAENACRDLAGIPDSHAVLFLQGGATMQFAQIPMNFLPPGGVADYADTGVWTSKAINEARRFGRVHVSFHGERSGYDHTPAPDELEFAEDAAYFHYCSNNTVCGTQYPTIPEGPAPLVADMSSDIFSRPLDVAAHAFIYAGGQKNLGLAGTVLIIADRGFIESGRSDLPTMLSYRHHLERGSRLNTPPTFGVYLMGRMFRWIADQGGLARFEAHNRAKAELLYEVIDGTDFYCGLARSACRSTMNITFRTPAEALDLRFLDAAEAEGFTGLKGHRSRGGLRASVYNAFPIDGCHALAEFMREFERRHG